MAGPTDPARAGQTQTTTTATAPAGPDPAQAQAQLDALRTAISPEWQAVLAPAEHDESQPATDRFKTAVYRRLLDPMTSGGVQALGAYCTADPRLLRLSTACHQAQDAVVTDRALLDEVKQAMFRFLGGGQTNDPSLVLMSDYPRITSLGRAWIKEQEWVGWLDTYAERGAARDAQAGGVAAGVARANTARTFAQTLRGNGTGIFATAPDAVPATAPGAAPGAPVRPPPQPGDPDFPLTDVQNTQLQALRRRILALAPEHHAAQPQGADYQVMETLTRDLRAADPVVQDRLRGDVEVTRRMTAAMAGTDMQQVAQALDSVEGLSRALTDPQGLPAGQTQFTMIRDYLLARRGTGPTDDAARELRMRVLSNASIMSLVSGFEQGQHQQILRLATRGTTDPDPLDPIYDAARGTGTAEAALRSMMTFPRNAPQLQALQTNPVFRDAIQHLTTPVTVDGLTVAPFAYMMRLWGLNAEGSGDPAVQHPGEINPGAVEPLDPAAWSEVDLFFTTTVNRLGGRLESHWYSADSWTSDSAVLEILNTFEVGCAAEHMRGLLQRGHIVPGEELTRRANQDSRIGDLRTKLHRCISDEHRVVAERVLGMRIDSAAVGQIGGAVRTAQDTMRDGTGHVPIAQAMRSIDAGGKTLSQLAHDTAVTISDQLESTVTHMWRKREGGPVVSTFGVYEQIFRSHAGELSQMTGMAQVDIHPIEYLVGAFHEVADGGDLATRIRERVKDDQVNSTLTGLGLDHDAVASRQVRQGAPPPEAGPEERYGGAATQLFQAITHYSGGGGGAFDRAPLDTIAAKMQAGMAIAAAPPPGAGTGPAMVAGPLEGAPPVPARVDGAADTPGTFAAYYRAQYGIEPHRHLIEFGRSFIPMAARRKQELLHPIQENAKGGGHVREPTDEERAAAATWDLQPAQVAAMLHVDAGEFSAAVPAPDEQININPAQVALGFDETAATSAAQAIWDQLHHGGDVVLIRQQFNARRAEEVRAINVAFRRLSGGIDIAFYLRQAAEQQGTNWGGLQVGGDGARAAGQASAQQGVSLYGDTGSMTEAADVAQMGHVAILTAVRNAVENTDRNELYRTVGQASAADRAKILGDAQTMNSLRQNLNRAEFDRVFAALNGTLDLTTMLWSRSTERSGVGAFFGTVDDAGMRTDIRDYIAARREVHMRELEARGGQVDQRELERLVLADAQRVYSDPAVRGVIENECHSLFRSGANSTGTELEGTIMNAGTDPHTGALLGNNWGNVSELLTGIRAMSGADRARWRNDPEFWLRVDALNPDQSQRQQITDALNGTEDGGADHLASIRSYVHDDGGDYNTAFQLLAHLTTAEVHQLQRDPTLVAQLQQRAAYEPHYQAVLTTVLGLREGPDAATDLGARQRRNADNTPMVDADGHPVYELPNIGGDVSAAEIDRLEQLKNSAIARIRYGVGRSWEEALREGVEVYRMDFRPSITARPAQPGADGAPGAPPTPARGAAQPPPQRETDHRAQQYRNQVWSALQGDVYPDDTDKRTTIEAAVRGVTDPSSTLIGRFTGVTYDNSSDIRATISNASNQLIVDSWSSIKTPKYAGGDGAGASYKDKYDTYKRIRDTRPAATPPPSGGGPATPPAQDPNLPRARMEFQRYAVEPSNAFEHLLLGYAGNDLLDPILGTPAARRPRTTRDGELQRDNPEWHTWRDLLQQRINALTPAEKLRGISAEGDADAANIVGSNLASAEQSFQRTREEYAFQRGDGYSFFGDDHGRELDRAFGEYGTAMGQAEDQVAGQPGTSDVSASQGRQLARMDQRVGERSAEYSQAREAAAHWAGLVVAAIIGAFVTALTAGAGSIAMVAIYGAITGAAATTGQVLTQEAILGRTYDASGEGLRTIASGALTGAVAAGAGFYAGRIVNSLSGLTNDAAALSQAQRVAGVAEGVKPPAWQTFLREAGHAGAVAGVQAGLSGFANVAGSFLSPDVWMHGWDEGWVRARQQAGVELRAIPLDVLRMSVSTMAAHIVPARAAPTITAGQTIGPDAVIGMIAAQLPRALVQGTLAAGMHGDATLGSIVTGGAETGLSTLRDVGQGAHGGSVEGAHQQARLTRAQEFAQREAITHATEWAGPNELHLFVANSSGAAPGDAGSQMTGAQFLAIRNQAARQGLAMAPGLTPAQQEAYVLWVRSAPSTAEFAERARTNPNEVADVRAAGNTAPTTAGAPPTADPNATPGTPAATAQGTPPAAQPGTPPPAATVGNAQAHVHSAAATTAGETAHAAAEAAHRAEDQFHIAPSAEAGRTALAAITADRDRAQAAVTTADTEVAAIQGMLRTAPEADRPGIQAELDAAMRGRDAAKAQAKVADLTRDMVDQEVNPQAARGGGTPTPPEQHGPTPPHETTPVAAIAPRPQDMSPESWMRLQELTRQHGQAEGLRLWRLAEENRTAAGEEINASIIPGTDFNGRGRAAADPGNVVLTASQEMATIQASLGGQVRLISEYAANTWYIEVADPRGGTANIVFTVRLSATDLPYTQVARSKINTQRNEHVIQLSSRVEDAQIRRALVHELTEIVAEVQIAATGAVPARVDALRAGEAPEPGATLSPHDQARVAEINLLAAQLAAAAPGSPEAAAARRELHALVDNLGLRQNTTGAPERMRLIDGNLTPGGRTQLTDLTRPVEALGPDDVAARQRTADTAAARDQAQLAAEARRAGDRPIAPLDRNGQPDPADLQRIARDAMVARQETSRRIVTQLLGLAIDPVTNARVYDGPVWVGGGASVTGLEPGTLFIDNRGRWQADHADRIAQTAGQLDGLRGAGLGDPHQFAGPDERVNLLAIQAWEDHIASQAKCVNGRASMAIENGHLIMTITPDEGGGGPIRLLVRGTPTIATGFPRENFAGQRMPTQAAVDMVRTWLQGNGFAATAGALPVRLATGDARAADADAGGQIGRIDPAAEAAIRASGNQDLIDALNTLHAAAEWQRARAADPTGARLLRGDEANTTDFRNNTCPNWIIAGTGGTAISAAEIILRETEGRPRPGPDGTMLPRVTVRMQGREITAGLLQNTQWQEVMRRYGPDSPDPRFSFDTGSVGEIRRDASGNFIVPTRTGDVATPGFIVAIGRSGALPPPIADYVGQVWAEQHGNPPTPGSSVTGELLYANGADPNSPDYDGQYLGYRLHVTQRQPDGTITRQAFDVTGAQSRFLPPEIFSASQLAQVAPQSRNAPQSTVDGTAQGRDAPSESGNFDGGYVSSAQQAAQYARRRRDGSLPVP
jgi:hypothetical protein